MAYEVAWRTTAAGNPPMALFTAAVSPPHIYAEAVMKLYVSRQMAEGEAIDVEEVMNTLRSWDKIPRETLMMVRVQIPSCFAKVVRNLFRLSLGPTVALYTPVAVICALLRVE